MRRISVVDYGIGNIFSICRSIVKAGFEFNLVTRPEEVYSSDYLLLPGVGSFERGMHELKSKNLIDSIREYVQKGKPLLGICLGMQMLFNESDEGLKEKGFGFIPGKVVRIVSENSSVKVPHIGWSCLKVNDSILLKENKNIKESIDEQFFYFVHSYHPIVESQYLLATTNYKNNFINAMVNKDNVIGCQFHPEKSGERGIKLFNLLLSR